MVQLKDIDLSTIEVLHCPHLSDVPEVAMRQDYDVLLIEENETPAGVVFHCKQCEKLVDEFLATHSELHSVRKLQLGEYALVKRDDKAGKSD